MATEPKPTTLGALRASGYQVLPVKVEMRKNLIDKMRKGEEYFPGILGYEDTILPQIENAILSGQDIVLLGERGQAKTRLARSLINLLDPEVPYIAGTELNDNPYAPESAQGRAMVAEMGDATPIDWLPRDRRYGEKLATPDTTIADLIGEVDPIKVAEGRYLSDEMTIHYGMVPRTNRGIFCINELPDLAERIQVGLLNIMEERDVQIRGYKVRLDLDMYIVVSANPEDYTNRGRIITPLKDRFGSEIRTHYPKTIEYEMDIMERERNHFADDGIAVDTPQYMKEIIAELTHLARKSPQISQKSGVSVRVSIANYENLVSSALRRAIILGEDTAVPRISDLPAVVASTAGKIELESMGEIDEQRVVERLVQQATATTFERHFRLSELEGVIRSFEKGMSLDVSDGMPARDYLRHMQSLAGMDAAVGKLGTPDEPAHAASAVEFILEGLHLNRRLNKNQDGARYRYRA
jgi:magnesium chelatase subunit I